MASVLLCTDEPVLAEGLKMILSGAEAFEFCAWCPKVEEIPENLERHQPDLLLVDLTSEVNFAVLSSLHGASSKARIVLWVNSIPTELALQAMSLGIRAIVRKTLPVETLLRCLARVREGELWFEKSLTDSIMSARRYTLTKREGQLITLLSRGLKNKEIATELTISEGTVKVYLSRLFQKLGVKDRFELALYGLKNLAPNITSADEKTAEGDRKPGSTVQTPRSFFVERTPAKPSRTESRLPLNQPTW